MLKFVVILVLAILVAGRAFSQSQSSKRDYSIQKGSLVILKDTTFVTRKDTVIRIQPASDIEIKRDPVKRSEEFYQKLDSISSRTKLTAQLFDFMIRRDSSEQHSDPGIVRSEEPFLPYEGKIIRSVRFVKVPLLEGSVKDTTRHIKTVAGRFVNKVHVNTQDFVLRKNLLFAPGDPVDAYQLADNERILRQTSVLKDCRIYLSQTTSPDSVDVTVVTQDVASLGVSGNYYTPHNYILDLFDLNMLGTARRFQVSYYRNAAEKKSNGVELSLSDPNLLGNFVQGQVLYSNNYLRQRVQATLERDFLTPSDPYAGGLTVYHTEEYFYPNEVDTLRQPYAENSADLWAGKSVFLGNRRNLVFSTRFSTRYFTDRPYTTADSNRYFISRSVALIKLTYQEQKYWRSTLIKGFGRTEDIPVGKFASFTVGREFSSVGNYMYYGLDLNSAVFNKRLGYFNAGLGLSSFLRGSQFSDGTIDVTALYFSPLIDFHKTKVREFIDAGYIRGFNRTYDRVVKLDGAWETNTGLPVLGDRRLTLKFETVYFTPWYFYGFRLAVFNQFGINWLAFQTRLINEENFFPEISAGVRMRNENLVFPTLVLKGSFFGNTNGYPVKYAVSLSVELEQIFNPNKTSKPTVRAFE